MVPVTRRRGFTLVELLIVIVIIGMLVTLLVPAVLRARETTRKALCMNNLSQLGKAIYNYEEGHHRLPPSCGYNKGSSGGSQVYESWSWLAYLLPYIDSPMSRTLTLKNGVPWQESQTSTTFHKDAFMAQVPAFKCPSAKTTVYKGALLKGFTGKTSGGTLNSVEGALTNYKALGGTTKDSLSQKISPGKPAVPYTGDHPDGILFPAAQDSACRWADITDGPGYTIMAVETIEPQFARWLIGTEATLAGLPSSSDPNPLGQVKYMSNYKIYAPSWFNGKFDDAGAAPSSAKTYLGYDYDTNKYDKTNNVQYGPSSQHAEGITNHLFGDATVRGLSKDIDPALYFFLITKSGNEPYGDLGIR